MQPMILFIFNTLMRSAKGKARGNFQRDDSVSSAMEPMDREPLQYNQHRIMLRGQQ